MNACPSRAQEIVANGTRGSGRGRPWKDRTHCLKGHEYVPQNIVWRSHGARRVEPANANANANATPAERPNHDITKHI